MPAPSVQRSHHSQIKLYDLWLLPCPCIVKCRMTNKICIRDLTSKEKKPLFCQRIQCVHHCQTWRHSIAAFDLWAGQHCSGIPTGSRNSRPVLFTSRPSQSIQVASSTSMMAKNSMAASLTSTSFLVLLLSSHVVSNPLPSNIFFPDTVKRFDINWGKSFLNFMIRKYTTRWSASQQQQRRRTSILPTPTTAESSGSAGDYYHCLCLCVQYCLCLCLWPQQL